MSPLRQRRAALEARIRKVKAWRDPDANELLDELEQKLAALNQLIRIREDTQRAGDDAAAQSLAAAHELAETIRKTKGAPDYARAWQPKNPGRWATARVYLPNKQYLVIDPNGRLAGSSNVAGSIQNDSARLFNLLALNPGWRRGIKRAYDAYIDARTRR